MRNRPELTVIHNSEEDALRAYFKRLYMVEKYILQVMMENDIQIQYRLIHTEMPRSFQGRIRFNGGVALGFNPYSHLPCALYTPLGAVDISRGFSTRENAVDDIARILSYRLELSEIGAVKSIVPGISQRVFALGRDPFGNPLPRASMLMDEAGETDKPIDDFVRNPETAINLWEKVRLHTEPSLHDEVMLSLPRNQTHLQRVA